MDDPRTVLTIARDILFLILLVVGPLLGFVLYRKTSAVLKSLGKTQESMAEIVGMVTRVFTRPAAGGGVGWDAWRGLKWAAGRRKQQGD